MSIEITPGRRDRQAYVNVSLPCATEAAEGAGLP
jgi:hypothetical protein